MTRLPNLVRIPNLVHLPNLACLPNLVRLPHLAGACAAEHELKESLAPVRRLGVYALGGKAFSFSVLERAVVGAQNGAALHGWRVLAAQRSLLIGAEHFDEAIVDFLVRESLLSAPDEL